MLARVCRVAWGFNRQKLELVVTLVNIVKTVVYLAELQMRTQNFHGVHDKAITDFENPGDGVVGYDHQTQLYVLGESNYLLYRLLVTIHD